jgi:predicted MPP superfamily phosphohydrolase
MRRLLLVCALLCGAAYAGLPASAQAPARIVAIGDIHGSIEGFTSILKVTGLIDSANKWIGGKAQLMQTGDYVDRGAGTRAVLDLLMALEPQARKAGGRAFALLGNHEVMNLIGETRDATPEIFASFADADSDKRRESAWQD